MEAKSGNSYNGRLCGYKEGKSSFQGEVSFIDNNSFVSEKSSAIGQLANFLEDFSPQSKEYAYSSITLQKSLKLAQSHIPQKLHSAKNMLASLCESFICHETTEQKAYLLKEDILLNYWKILYQLGERKTAYEALQKYIGILESEGQSKSGKNRLHLLMLISAKQQFNKENYQQALLQVDRSLKKRDSNECHMLKASYLKAKVYSRTKQVQLELQEIKKCLMYFNKLATKGSQQYFGDQFFKNLKKRQAELLKSNKVLTSTSKKEFRRTLSVHKCREKIDLMTTVKKSKQLGNFTRPKSYSKICVPEKPKLVSKLDITKTRPKLKKRTLRKVEDHELASLDVLRSIQSCVPHTDYQSMLLRRPNSFVKQKQLEQQPKQPDSKSKSSEEFQELDASSDSNRNEQVSKLINQMQNEILSNYISQLRTQQDSEPSEGSIQTLGIIQPQAKLQEEQRFHKLICQKVILGIGFVQYLEVELSRLSSSYQQNERQEYQVVCLAIRGIVCGEKIKAQLQFPVTLGSNNSPSSILRRTILSLHLQFFTAHIYKLQQNNKETSKRLSKEEKVQKQKETQRQNHSSDKKANQSDCKGEKGKFYLNPRQEPQELNEDTMVQLLLFIIKYNVEFVSGVTGRRLVQIGSSNSLSPLRTESLNSKKKLQKYREMINIFQFKQRKGLEVVNHLHSPLQQENKFNCMASPHSRIQMLEYYHKALKEDQKLQIQASKFSSNPPLALLEQQNSKSIQDEEQADRSITDYFIGFNRVVTLSEFYHSIKYRMIQSDSENRILNIFFRNLQINRQVKIKRRKIAIKMVCYYRDTSENEYFLALELQDKDKRIRKAKIILSSWDLQEVVGYVPKFQPICGFLFNLLSNISLKLVLRKTHLYYSLALESSQRFYLVNKFISKSTSYPIQFPNRFLTQQLQIVQTIYQKTLKVNYGVRRLYVVVTITQIKGCDFMSVQVYVQRILRRYSFRLTEKVLFCLSPEHVEWILGGEKTEFSVFDCLSNRPIPKQMWSRFLDLFQFTLHINASGHYGVIVISGYRAFLKDRSFSEYFDIQQNFYYMQMSFSNKNNSEPKLYLKDKTVLSKKTNDNSKSLNQGWLKNKMKRVYNSECKNYILYLSISHITQKTAESHTKQDNHGTKLNICFRFSDLLQLFRVYKNGGHQSEEAYYNHAQILASLRKLNQLILRELSLLAQKSPSKLKQLFSHSHQQQLFKMKIDRALGSKEHRLSINAAKKNAGITFHQQKLPLVKQIFEKSIKNPSLINKTVFLARKSQISSIFFSQEKKEFLFSINGGKGLEVKKSVSLKASPYPYLKHLGQEDLQASGRRLQRYYRNMLLLNNQIQNQQRYNH